MNNIPSSSSSFFKVKNLDTGEYIDIEEASQRYNVMELETNSSKEDDKLSNDFNSYQELSEDEEDYYFDSMLEKLKLELQESQPPTIRIQNNSKLRFVRISGYQIVSDNENRKFCIFTLDIQCNTADPQTWKVYRRYSEFRKLSKILRSEGFYVPVMPPKSLFQTISSDFLSKRSKDLEAWLLHLSLQNLIDRSAPDPSFHPNFQEFLSHQANYPPYIIPPPPPLLSLSIHKNNNINSQNDFRQNNSTYSDDINSYRVVPLRDESKTQELDAKYGEYLQRPKVGVDDFELIRVIGKGSFGKVTLVKKKTSGRLYAMKVLTKSHILKRKQIEHTKTERRVLGVIDHPFIVKLHYAFQTNSKLYFVLDYAAGGELFFHLTRMKRFPEHIAQFYAAELASALDALHQIGVIYRDLKPENILLDREGHIKLADFGLAKENINHPTVGASSLCGTPEYLSPEVLNRQGHGHAVDWWNLGMVLYEMLTGLPPWYTTDKSVLFDRIRTAPIKFPIYLSRPAAHFIHNILNKDPSLRLGSASSQEVFNHPFFSSIDWNQLNQRLLVPPFNPCNDLKYETDTINFENEFTKMNLYSMEDLETNSNQLTASTSPTNSNPKLSPSSIEYKSPSSSNIFSHFTFGEDSYLESISSRWERQVAERKE